MTWLLLMSHCSSCPEIQGVANIRDLDLSNYKCNYYLSNFIFTAITRLLIKHGPFHALTLFGAFVKGMSSSVGPLRVLGGRLTKWSWQKTAVKNGMGAAVQPSRRLCWRGLSKRKTLLSCSHMEESVLLGRCSFTPPARLSFLKVVGCHGGI